MFETTLAKMGASSSHDAVERNPRDLKHDAGTDSQKSKRLSIEKINAQGEYLPFYGYTIVSHAAERKNYEFIKKYIRKSKTLSKYISALPTSSYHVTIFDIFSQKRVPAKYTPKSGSVPSEDWSQTIEALNADLSAAQKIIEEVDWDTYFWKPSLSTGKVLKINGNLTNPEAVLELRQRFLSIFGATPTLNLKYHMTLGYLLRNIAEEDKGSYQEEVNNLQKLLPEQYKLERPAVCYFESMEAFVPVRNLLGKKA